MTGPDLDPADATGEPADCHRGRRDLGDLNAGPSRGRPYPRGLGDRQDDGGRLEPPHPPRDTR